MELKCSKKELAIEILEKIKSAIERLEERTKDIKSVDDFLTSSYGMEKLDASCMLLIAIGESIKSFDKITDKKVLCEDASIPWTEIMGVRDIIAHHYFDIDAEECRRSLGIVHRRHSCPYWLVLLPQCLKNNSIFVNSSSYTINRRR